MIIIITIIIAIIMSFTPATQFADYPVPAYNESGAYIVSVDKIVCKDGYQYEVDYSDGSHESYFQCDSEAINELLKELEEKKQK